MTTAFRFRLDPILRLRHFELRRSLVALGGARRALAEGRARESAAREEAARVAGEADRALSAGVPAAPFVVRRQTVEAWQRQAALAAREVHRLEERVARCEAAAAGARLRVEALERLRERALARWRAECERRRQRDLDEMATARWARAREAR